jgi:hypothetical protein
MKYKIRINPSQIGQGSNTKSNTNIPGKDIFSLDYMDWIIFGLAESP